MDRAPAAALVMVASLGGSGLAVGAVAALSKRATWWAALVLLGFRTGTWLNSPYHSAPGAPSSWSSLPFRPASDRSRARSRPIRRGSTDSDPSFVSSVQLVRHRLSASASATSGNCPRPAAVGSPRPDELLSTAARLTGLCTSISRSRVLPRERQRRCRTNSSSSWPRGRYWWRSRPGCRTGVAAELLLQAGHADQDQGDVVAVVAIAQQFERGGTEPFGLVDDDQLHVVPAVPPRPDLLGGLRRGVRFPRRPAH